TSIAHRANVLPLISSSLLIMHPVVHNKTPAARGIRRHVYCITLALEWDFLIIDTRELVNEINIGAIWLANDHWLIRYENLDIFRQVCKPIFECLLAEFLLLTPIFKSKLVVCLESLLDVILDLSLDRSVTVPRCAHFLNTCTRCISTPCAS